MDQAPGISATTNSRRYQHKTYDELNALIKNYTGILDDRTRVHSGYTYAMTNKLLFDAICELEREIALRIQAMDDEDLSVILPG